MSLCLCCDSKPKFINKTISLIGNNEELMSKLFRSITGSNLVFGEQPTYQASVTIKNKRIIVTAIKHDKNNMTIAEMNVVFASGVIIVLDAIKDISAVEDYIRIIQSNIGSSVDKEQRKIFFAVGMNQNLIDKIEQTNPTYFAMEPETSWFVKDTESNVYKFVETL